MKKYINKYLFTASILAVLTLPVMGSSTGDISSPLKLSVHEPAVYSPQVMELMRYDNHAAIDLNTGCIAPSINLVHFQDQDFDFPVSITYNSSGFRPRNADNYVGRDWMLNAGGIVYRQVNGMPDDLEAYMENPDQLYAYTGFLKMLGKNTYNTSAMKQEVAQNPYKYAHLKSLASSMLTLPSTDNNKPVEASPDIFYFSFGKHSGKFMINYDGSVSVVGYNGGKYQVDLTEMKLFSNTAPQETCIRIKTDDGYIYTFGGGGYAALEYSALSWQSDYNFTPNPSKGHHEITAFHLTRITAPNGRALDIYYRDIDRKYHTTPHSDLVVLNQQGNYENRTDLLMQYQLCGKTTISTPYGVGAMNASTGISSPIYAQNNVYRSYSLNKVALIDHIETDGCTISFTYSTRSKQPLPVTNTAKQFFTNCGAKLDGIRMEYNGSTQLAQLTYDYAVGNRMFLKRVKTNKEGTFRMEYNTPLLSETPNPLTSNIDHWGFWRGENANVALIPGMSYPFSQYSLDYKTTTDHRNATGKRYDVSLLRQMTYPTGGRVEFNYEPHKYSTIVQAGSATFYPTDYSLSPSLSGLAGGARVRSIRYMDATGKVQKETVYTYGSPSKEGKVMYMPFYRHLLVEADNNSARITVKGAAFNSEGFTDISYPGIHIRYPEVTEHYIDSSKGGLEQKHSYKKTEFQTNQGISSSYYNTNEYFQILSTTGDSHIYTLFAEDYKRHLKHLVAHSTDDASLYYAKISRETYYDENDVMRKKIDYRYAYHNEDNYNLCLFSPNISGRQMFNLFAHIGKEYFRMLLPVSTRTTDYYGAQGEQQREQWEYMKYDGSGYLIESSQPKNKIDSLITVYQYAEYSTKNKFQTLPTAEWHYSGTSGKRQLLDCRKTEYRLPGSIGAQEWKVVSKESLFDGNGKLAGKIEYTHYDKYGNPVEAVENGSRHIVFLWSHYGQNLRARIENASYQEVSAALGKNPELLSTSATDISALNNVRLQLPQARVYSYWAGYGKDITVCTAVNGRNIYYNYYTSGRLSQIYRHSEKGRTEVIQTNAYHFVNE